LQGLVHKALLTKIQFTYLEAILEKAENTLMICVNILSKKAHGMSLNFLNLFKDYAVTRWISPCTED
jgi:hypothetical protein